MLFNHQLMLINHIFSPSLEKQRALTGSVCQWKIVFICFEDLVNLCRKSVKAYLINEEI